MCSSVSTLTNELEDGIKEALQQTDALHRPLTAHVAESCGINERLGVRRDSDIDEVQLGLSATKTEIL